MFVRNVCKYSRSEYKLSLRKYCRRAPDIDGMELGREVGGFDPGVWMRGHAERVGARATHMRTPCERPRAPA